ncbi:MAG: NADAR family protein, partial [Aeromonadaceae bacterium]
MIDSFSGEYRFLSNFWPCNVTLDGATYPSVEHAYQAAKTSSTFERLRVIACATPGDAKRAGRTLTIRPDWDAIKVSVMRDLVCQKFADPQLAALLASTRGRQLVEGNNWGDTFWGVCRGEGQNNLGKILMSIRDGATSVPPPPPAPCAPPPPPAAVGVLIPPEVPCAPAPSKPVAFWDTEVYPNYFLLKFRRKGERTAYTFDLRAGQRFDQQSIDAMRHLFNTHLTVSYNGLGFDRYVMSVVLNGGDVERARWVRDQIIVQKVKGWQLNLPEWDPADHIDLIEIVPGDASLKLCAARIHSRSIRDLPYDPNIDLTEPQIVEMGTYCENDLDDLEDLW